MIARIVAATIAAFSLFVSPYAAAWWMEDGKPRYLVSEVRWCQLVAIDAVDVMAAKQFKEPLAEYDGILGELGVGYRFRLEEKVKGYPVGDTQDDKTKILRQFVEDVQVMCWDDHRKVVAPTEPQPGPSFRG